MQLLRATSSALHVNTDAIEIQAGGATPAELSGDIVMRTASSPQRSTPQFRPKRAPSNPILGQNPFPSPFLNLYHVDSMSSNDGAAFWRRSSSARHLEESSLPGSSEVQRAGGFDFANLDQWMEKLLTHAASGESASIHRARSAGSNSAHDPGLLLRRSHSAPPDKRPSLGDAAPSPRSNGARNASQLPMGDPESPLGLADDAPVFAEANGSILESPAFAMGNRDSLFNSFQTLQTSRTSERHDLVRARWKKAMWYAIGEAQKRRKREVYNLECTRIESGRSFVDSIVGDSAVVPLEKVEPDSSAIVAWTKAALGSNVAQVLFIMATIYVLVVPDAYWLCVASNTNDSILLAITFGVACVLSVEILLRLVAEPPYRVSLMLLVDVLATISLVPQISWLLAEADFLEGSEGLGAARVVRVGQLGARVLRMARMARLVLRLKWMYTRRGRAGGEDDVVEVVEGNGVGLGFGESLQSEAFNIIVATVFTLLLGALAMEVYLVLDSANEVLVRLSLCTISQSVVASAGGAARRGEAWGGAGKGGGGVGVLGAEGEEGRRARSAVAEVAVAEAQKWLGDAGKEVLLLEVQGEVLMGGEGEMEGKRQYPKEWWTVEVGPEDGCPAGRMAVYDREAARRRYGRELVLVGVVTVVVVASTWAMNHKLWHAAALPTWRMLVFVQRFANDPLGRMAFPNKGQHRELIGLHTALMKLACLLQLAWGVAGSRVIGQSLRGETQEASTIVHAFFGFCDIRNFTGLTEVLQSEVIHVVNGIAQYVHAAVAASGGFPNKNIGDAFLMVWKPSYEVNIQDAALHALLSYIQIIIELSRSKVLNRWIKSDVIQSALPGYKLELGFGLHHGWAVEGSVGSPMKIDATYISPHVNMASRLEAATKQYGVQILLSGEAHALLPPHVQGLCRRVDRVLVKGSNRPVNLWTYDVPRLRRFGGSIDNFINITEPSVSPAALLERVPPRTSSLFRQRFAAAMDAYLGGEEGRLADWGTAVELFEGCLQMEEGRKDGPCLAVLDHMRREGWQQGGAAKDWKGFRALVEK